MTTGWPSNSVIFGCNSRKNTSLLPPGAAGLTILIGLVGNVCACACGTVASISAHASADALVVRFICSAWPISFTVTSERVTSDEHHHLSDIVLDPADTARLNESLCRRGCHGAAAPVWRKPARHASSADEFAHRLPARKLY